MKTAKQSLSKTDACKAIKTANVMQLGAFIFSLVSNIYSCNFFKCEMKLQKACKLLFTGLSFCEYIYFQRVFFS